jgi:hypothetical protein
MTHSTPSKPIKSQNLGLDRGMPYMRVDCTNHGTLHYLTVTSLGWGGFGFPVLVVGYLSFFVFSGLVCYLQEMGRWVGLLIEGVIASNGPAMERGVLFVGMFPWVLFELFFYSWVSIGVMHLVLFFVGFWSRLGVCFV